MTASEDLVRTRSLLEQLNIGVIKYLEKKTGVTKVDLEQRGPADRHAVLMWEQRNTCMLPDDLKNFYMTNDGFRLTWSIKMDNGPIQLGKLHINRVNQLIRVGGNQATSHVNPTLADLEGDSDLEDEVSGLEKPTFDNRCKIFELDPCDGYGKVCLVFKENRSGGNDPKVEIWFLDRALRWHFLTDSFMAYYRLMLMHLGLPQWQYGLTDIGLSQQAQQWFNMYASTRLELDKEIPCDSGVGSGSTPPTSQLDINKVFKGKTDKKKPTGTQVQNVGNVKKKPVVTSAKSQPTPMNRVTASSSQVSNKTPK
ncbi:hypothetical protein FSP39_024541 [Pinctada imbricata]|uniref:Knr4/Smi1-like domain-containing protein n=1 Tax=Pinctada imbricata TaxID=66713 RepID=A0AA88Y5L0_PINIB|nr:hypothetical protein FSP39_024541 [Pinctada imbricata]